jgi:hypothetical protein
MIMNRRPSERSISTTANIQLSDGNGQEFDISRELVLQENQDGTWLIYALRPKPSGANDGGEGMVSGSIKVSDHATMAFLIDLFTLLADPGGFEKGTASR